MRIKKLSVIRSLFSLMLIAAGPMLPAYSETIYTITDLGPIGLQSSDITNTRKARSINNRGEVLITKNSLTNGLMRAHIYANGVMTELDAPVDCPMPGCNVFGHDIDDTGRVVGTADNAISGPQYRKGAVYSNGSWSVIPPSSSNDWIYGVNSSGTVVGHLNPAEYPLSYAYPAKGTVNGILSRLILNVQGGIATRINDAGDIIGTYGLLNPYGEARPLVILNGGLIDISNNGALGTITPEAINESGHVVGSLTNGGVPHAFLYANGALSDIVSSLHTNNIQNSVALGINDDGQVVGWALSSQSIQFSTAIQHAFIWFNGVMTDLNNQIDPVLGWELTHAEGINNARDIIGYGFAPDKTQHIFLLRLSTPTSQPDLLIGPKPLTAVGNNIYNLTGLNQSATKSLAKGKSANFSVYLTNDGNAADTFKLKGPAGNQNFGISYYKGKKDITADVVKGKYSSGNMVSQASITLKVSVTGKSNLKNKKLNILLRADSTVDKTKKDVVKIAVSSTGK